MKNVNVTVSPEYPCLNSQKILGRSIPYAYYLITDSVTAIVVAVVEI